MIELFGREFSFSIAFVGLGGAGKTTLINTLRKQTPEENVTFTTRGMNIEVMTYTKADEDYVEFLAIDLGGQDDLLRVWKPQIESAQAVCFMFDGTDPQSAESARTWLFRIHDWMKKDASLLFLCNKNDLENCMSLDEAIKSLDLTKLLEIRPHSLGLYHVSALYNENIHDAFEWLINKIQDDLRHARI